MQTNQVFRAINTPETWIGVDVRVCLATAVVAGAAMWAFQSLMAAIVILMVGWGFGVVGSKRDPQFLAMIPLAIQLKKRYEPGRRK